VGLEEDCISLYSFNQILKSPSLLQGLSTPSPPVEPNAKKRPSLFRLSSSKKGSANVVTDAVCSDEVTASSPMETKGAKQKKLQKPMPESVRQERKTQMKKQRQDRRESGAPEATVSESYQIPLPVELSSAGRARFSFEPIPTPIATVDPTPVVVSANELQGDVHHTTAELNGDDGFASEDEEPATPMLSLFRSRSKRRTTGPPRTVGLQEPSAEKKVENSTPANTPHGRNTTPKQSGFGVGPISCIARNDNDSETIPLWTDHASVSRTLGCGPYDVSTGLLRRSVAVPSAVMHQVQAPHEMTTSLSRSKNGGLRGMDSGMASELARMKSRDVAINKNEEVYDRPRMAKPKSRKDKSKGESSARVPLLTEDRFPSREQIVETSLTTDLVELPARNSMYSESIPPMPELPADVQVKVTRIDQMAARRKKDSAQPMPVEPARSNGERPGDSTISVADAIRRVRSSRSVLESNEDKGIKVPRTKPSGPRKKKSHRIEPPEISSSDSDGPITGRQHSSQEEDSLAPITDSKPPDRSSLEQQAKHWRQHRRSAEQALGKSKSEDCVVLHTSTTTTASPSIVVSTHIASQGGETRTESQTHTQTQVHTETVVRQRKDSASLQADAYRALIGEERRDTPTPSSEEREEYFSYSAAKSVTVQRLTEQRPATVTVAPLSPGLSRLAVSPPEPPIERARSPGGRVITPSGNYYPYTPADAAQAERSRAESLAKLTGTPVPITALPSMPKEPTPKQPAPKRTSPKAHKNAIEALFDRYSGGLEYSYERGVGVGGSAGTRSTKDSSRRKSKELSEGWGVDLSDVPVFLEKVAQT
jgi:hypothetical protein